MPDNSVPSQQVPLQEIIALQQAKSNLDASLKEQLNKAEAEYKKQLSELENRYSKSGISVFDSINRADFASEKYKLDQNFKNECDFLKSVHNKTYGNTREELQEELEQKIKNLNYDLKTLVLKHQGELIANMKPSSLLSQEEAPQKIVEWFSAMKTMKTHTAEERIKLIEHTHTSLFVQPTEKELLDLISEPQPLKESDSIQDLMSEMLENPPTIITLSTEGQKNYIGVFQDQQGIWLYDPGRLTVCFSFNNQDPQAAKEKVQQFIKNYQQLSYPATTHTALIAKAKKMSSVDIESLVQTPTVLHQKDLANKHIPHATGVKKTAKERTTKKIKKKK